MTEHAFTVQGQRFTLLSEIPLAAFLLPPTVNAVYELVCSSVTDRPGVEQALDDPDVTLSLLNSIADWITECVSERPLDTACFIWSWGRVNLLYLEGRMLLAGRNLDTLSARRFFAVAYTLMTEEAGGRGVLESRLEELVDEAKVFVEARMAGDKQDPKWDQADKLAMELLNEGAS